MLEVRDVSVAFGGVKALNGFSLEVGAGEIVGLIGPNGAGKTTLFDAISGFVTTTSGTILFESADVVGLSPAKRAKRGIGRSFQNTSLFPAMTVRENIAVAGEKHLKMKNPVAAALWLPGVRRSEKAMKRRVDSLIESLGLSAYADKFVNELSTGTRRAVDIACVMASEPRLLLLDEPSSGLAQAETEELGPVLLGLRRETGCSILLIEHDVDLISATSDRLVAMHLGEKLAEGSPTEVLEAPEVMAAYLTTREGETNKDSPIAVAAPGDADGVN